MPELILERLARDVTARGLVGDYFNTHTNITATKPKPFPDDKQADILLSSITTIDNPAARNWHLDVTSTNPMGVTNHRRLEAAPLQPEVQGRRL